MAGELAARVARTVRAEVRRIRAYHVAGSDGLLKLDAMENPYEWPDALRERWREVLESEQVNRYPDPEAPALKSLLRRRMGVPPGCGLVVGNGSDELIQLLLLAVGEGAAVLAPEPSFSMYRLSSEALGRRFVGVALRADDFALDPDAMLAAIDAERPAVVFLAYPNNPTGNLFDRAVLEAVIDAAPGMVVVDEAYAPFAGETFMADLDRREHLLVMRTVSKLGLAGLRLGLLAGAPAWTAELDKVRLPYNVGRLTQAAAVLALEHYELFEEQTRLILAEREGLRRRIAAINRLQVWPSDANFLLVRAAPGEGPHTVAALRDAGILVRDLHGSSELLVDCFRVTVGRPEECDALVEALHAVAG